MFPHFLLPHRLIPRVDRLPLCMATGWRVTNRVAGNREIGALIKGRLKEADFLLSTDHCA